MAQQLAGKALPAPKTAVPLQVERQRRNRHTERVRRHKKIWKLLRADHRREEIARMVGVSSRSVYRVLEHEQPRGRERRRWTRHITDPYLSSLSDRWNEGCHQAVQLYEEVVAEAIYGIAADD